MKLKQPLQLAIYSFYARISFNTSNVILIISTTQCLNIPNNGSCHFKY